MQVPRELVEAAQRGDPGAFDELVRTTHRYVYSLVHRIVGNADDAADVTQDIYVRVWRSIHRFRGEGNFLTWLHQVSSNASLNHIRDRARAGLPMDPEHAPEQSVPDASEQVGDAQVLEQALRRLPAQQRAVVVLRDVYGWSIEEIGRKMRTTEGAAKVRLFRARQRLADELASAGVVVPMKKRKKSS